jgi:hypothetical protein
VLPQCENVNKVFDCLLFYYNKIKMDLKPEWFCNCSFVSIKTLKMKKKLLLFASISLFTGLSVAQTLVTGPSSSASPYLIPSIPNTTITSILTASDNIGGYKMVGLADGAGAYDNNDGTFSLLVNHEVGSTNGVARAHGQTGAFVSKWVINKNTLTVLSGADLTTTVNLWTGTTYTAYTAANSNSLCAFGRFCSADLAEISAFYNSATSTGTQDRIFLNGEEIGSEGRAFAHIATGASAGQTFQLPHLGRASWENAVAAPNTGNKTVVGLMDDASPGQVYFYVGNKTNTGNVITRAGLTGGNLYGVAVTGLLAETSASVVTAGTPFALVNLGDVSAISGSSLNTISTNSGVTTFLRPEDGAWDPSVPGVFYFVTTNSFTSPSRLWKLQFTNPLNPENGGTITAVLDGTEGQKMFDNLCLNNMGEIFLQEDPGGQLHIAKIWKYTIATDALSLVAEHDPNRFVTGAANFLTIDEEASGILDASSILGAGTYLFGDQAHYSIPGEIVEGGQILVMKIGASTTELNSTTINNDIIQVYPNPTNDKLNVLITSNSKQHAEIKLTAVTGKVVAVNRFQNLEVGKNKLTISTQNLPNGIYFLNADVDQELTVIKVIIAH